MTSNRRPRNARAKGGHARSAIPLAGLISAALLCIGCATKPPPTFAEIQQQSGVAKFPLDKEWKAGAVAGPVADNWLAAFGDPQLNALVAEAMANNPDLRVSAVRVEQASEYVELAKAALRPAIGLFGTGGINASGGDTSSALQGISLGASWEPDLWGRMRYSRNAYEATYASTKADYEYGRQSLAAAVAKSWFTASESWLQLQLAESTVNSGEKLVKLAELRWHVGPGSEQDVTAARANLSTYKDAAIQVQFAHAQTLRALELLIGRYPAAELQSRHSLPALNGALPAGLPLNMLERRPDMIAAERRVAAAFNRVGEAKAARLPSITLNANVAAFESDVLQLKKDYDNPSLGAGARLLAPIYEGGALKTQVEIRTLEQKQAVAEYARLALRALGDVENALAAGQMLSKREQLLQNSLANNQRTLVLMQASYRVGRADQRTVQLQQMAVNAARLALLQVQSEQLAQRVNLHLALGGSFEARPQQVAKTAPTPNAP